MDRRNTNLDKQGMNRVRVLKDRLLGPPGRPPDPKQVLKTATCKMGPSSVGATFYPSFFLVLPFRSLLTQCSP